MRPARAAYVVGVVGLLLLAACSSGKDHPDAQDQPSESPTTQAAAFNPCDDLSPDIVGAALGVEVTEETGEADNPRCAFVPVAKGGPTLNVNYLWFKGSFNQAWASMGDLPGDVSRLRIDTADNARLVVNETPEAVVITGFVQTGDLIESVNAIQLKPFNRDTMTRAATKVLTALSAQAPSRD